MEVTLLHGLRVLQVGPEQPLEVQTRFVRHVWTDSRVLGLVGLIREDLLDRLVKLSDRGVHGDDVLAARAYGCIWQKIGSAL